VSEIAITIPPNSAFVLNDPLRLSRLKEPFIALCGIEIRISKFDDRQKIINIINKIASERQYFHTDRFLITPSWETLLDKGFCEQGVLIVVERHKEIIGYGRLTRLSQLEENAEWDVGLGLLREYRSNGIGSFLLACLLKWTGPLRIKKIHATILDHNIRSRKLFWRMGFKETISHAVKLPYQERQVYEVKMCLDVTQG